MRTGMQVYSMTVYHWQTIGSPVVTLVATVMVQQLVSNKGKTSIRAARSKVMQIPKLLVFIPRWLGVNTGHIITE